MFCDLKDVAHEHALRLAEGRPHGHHHAAVPVQQGGPAPPAARRRENAFRGSWLSQCSPHRPRPRLWLQSGSRENNMSGTHPSRLRAKPDASVRLGEDGRWLNAKTVRPCATASVRRGRSGSLLRTRTSVRCGSDHLRPPISQASKLERDRYLPAFRRHSLAVLVWPIAA